MAKAEANGSLKDAQMQQVANLIARINTTKKKIENLGFDPKTVTVVVQKPKKRKSKTGTRARQGGVGMYGLGASLKSWR